MNPKAVLEFAAANNVKILDLRFTDLPGLWHHVSFPIHELHEASFEEGFGMDGSSIRGWAAIHESDMLLVPDPSWYMLDPFTDTPTLVMIGDIVDPVTKQHYVRDPRNVAKKAETYLAYTGIADKAYFGAEAEFFIFDNIRFDQAQQHGYYFIDAEEGRWNSGREKDNLGYRPRYRIGPRLTSYVRGLDVRARDRGNCGFEELRRFDAVRIFFLRSEPVEHGLDGKHH